MSLWNAVCSVLLCKSVRKRTSLRLAGEYFLSQSAQSSRSFLAHCFEPTERLRHTEFTEAFQLRLAVTFCDIGWLNVSVEYRVFCSSVFSVRKNMSFFICHYVILSKKTDLSSFVIMSFCLKRTTCLPPSSCYSVLKTTPSVTPVLLCYPVSHTLSPPVLMLLCLKNHPICYLCLTLLPCLPYPVSPVLGYSVFQAEARGEGSGKSFPAHGEL